MSTQTTPTSGAQGAAGGAKAVGHETKDAASQVAGTATDEAKKVAREASDQARQLWHQARSDLTDQAGSQQDRAAQGLRQLSDQLRAMADGAQDDGMARSLVDDVARRAGDAAGFLEGRDPGALLDEARRFAQRRPGAFLAIAAGLGVVAGRMSRGIVEEKREEQAGPTGGSLSTAPGASAAPVGSGSLAATGVDDAGMPSATAPTQFTTESTPISPAAGPQTAESGNAAIPGAELPGPHRTTQPIETDGTPSPIGDDGLLAGQDPDRGTR